MPAKQNIYGWDGTQWVPILVNAAGKLLIEESLTSKIITDSRDMTAVSGDVAYTGVGFKPSVILAFASDGAAASSIGFSDSAKTV